MRGYLWRGDVPLHASGSRNMTAIQTVVHPHAGRYGSRDLRSAGTLASPCGLAHVRDTINRRDGRCRIAHVYWPADSEHQHGNQLDT
jgi:hypothetical protein